MDPELVNIRLSDVVFDEAIYPRKEHDPALAQRYATVIDSIEAAGHYIALTPDHKLLDGKHRWLAYRTAYEAEPDRQIKAMVYPVTEAREQFSLAVELNSQHGYQLTNEDKKQSAVALYGFGYSYDTIAAKLSVRKATVSEWLSRTVKEQRDRANVKIMDMWLACHTQQEIADALGMPQKTVDDRIKVLADEFPRNQTAKITFQDGFDPPLYNVWKQQDKSNKVGHFGNSEERWVENLLYLYTEPLNVVVDPFAGGGSTIDVCKRRGRRYFVSDRKPIKVRETEIRLHDLTAGLPPLPRWQDVRLVYFDPPYWLQAAGQYSDDPTDLANMPLDKFNETLAGIINGFGAKLKGTGAAIALLMQPTQWKAPEKRYTDHVADMLRLVKMPIDLRVQCPYESQQCTAQMVDWAKANRKVLVLSRELVIWRAA